MGPRSFRSTFDICPATTNNLGRHSTPSPSHLTYTHSTASTMARWQTCRTPLDAVAAVEQYLRTSSPQREAALRALRHDINAFFRPRLDGRYNSQPERPLQILGEEIARLLFGWDCRGIVHFQWEPDFWSNEGYLGGTWSSAALERIVVSIDPYAQAVSRARRTDDRLSTLVHQVVHANLRFVACDGSWCDSTVCWYLADRETGSDGHGDAFLRLATIAQREVRAWGLWDMYLDLRFEAERFCGEESRFLFRETVLLCWPGERVQYDIVYCQGRAQLALSWSGT